MKDVREWLKEGDPLSAQPGLSADDTRFMRRVIVAAAQEVKTVDWAWPRPWVLATVVGLSLAVGITIGARLPSRDGTSPPAKAQTNERRQIQFETSGGTRIIWVLNPEFKL